jgi:DNA-directed RNA polymerase subunit N (RpoN/RPB10)
MDIDEDGKINLIPKVCWNCQNPLDKKMYLNLINEGMKGDEALDKMGYARICCRRHLLGGAFELERVLNLYQEDK